MKIKYITNVRIPTSRAQGYAIMKMCEKFVEAGADLELVVPNRQNNEKEKDPFVHYGVKNNFNIKKLWSFDLLGPYEAFGKLFYWIDFISFLVSVFLYSRRLGKEIIYTRDYLLTLFVPKSKFLILEIHDLPSNDFLFNKALLRAKAIIVITNSLKKELISRGVQANYIYIFPSGVELGDFQIKESKEEAKIRLNLPNDKPLVVYTGQLYDWKGTDTLAEAAKHVPEANFVFVGGVDPELTKFRSNYGALPNITIRESAPRKEMPLYVRSADVLVLPNSGKSKISTLYTSPIKLFEYLASGKPIVVSNLPSIREIVSEKEVAFATPDDSSSFASAINTILRDQSLAQSISKGALEKSKQFGWGERALKICHIIRDIKKHG